MTSEQRDLAEMAANQVAARMVALEITRRCWNRLGVRRLSFREAYCVSAVWTFMWRIAADGFWAAKVHQDRLRKKAEKAGLAEHF